MSMLVVGGVAAIGIGAFKAFGGAKKARKAKKAAAIAKKEMNK